MNARRRGGWLLAIAALVLALLVLGALGAWAWQASHGPALPEAVAGADAGLDDPALIARGAYLARVGDCAGCHTARGGASYAGGRVIATPFGDVPAGNLTPDRATGLGEWSFTAFWRALHTGMRRDGQWLYPVFPYTAYTQVDRADARAIFAYLRTLPPVHHAVAGNTLRFPYDLRAAIAVWRALYFRPQGFVPDPARSAAWNRGAYLVQGLGHCNACHAPRDRLGGQSDALAFSGGMLPAQGWYAPDLSMAANGGMDGWSASDVVDLLRSGQSARGTAFGPMAEVVEKSTQYLSDADLDAIATYLQALPPRLPRAPAATAIDVSTLLSRGQRVYAARCAACHGGDGRGIAGVYPPLDRNPAVTEPSGVDATRIVLLGGFAPSTRDNPRPYSMPPFAQQLNDADVAAVVSYIRQAWHNQAAPVQARDVAASRTIPLR